MGSILTSPTKATQKGDPVSSYTKNPKATVSSHRMTFVVAPHRPEPSVSRVAE